MSQFAADIESINNSLRDVGSQLKAHHREREEQSARLQHLEQVSATMRNESGGRHVGGTDCLRSFLDSGQLQAMRDGQPTTGRVALPDLSIRAALTNDGRGVTGSTNYNVNPERADGIFNDPRRGLVLLNSLPVLPVTTGTFEFMQLSGYTNSAAVQVKEGDLKAEANITTAIATANIATIAHWVRASLQVLQDAPALEQRLNDLLIYGVLAKLESEVINGVGGTGKILGLKTQATVFTPPTGLAVADRIGAAATGLASAGWNANLIVLNPADWFAVTSERADGDGQYVMGSPRDPAPPSLWNVPVALTPSLAAGTALVLDVNQTALLDRMQAVAVASREDGANLTSNLVTLLAELRAGLAVFAAGAVQQVDLTD